MKLSKLEIENLHKLSSGEIKTLCLYTESIKNICESILGMQEALETWKHNNHHGLEVIECNCIPCEAIAKFGLNE